MALLATGCGVRRSPLGDGGDPATADQDGGDELAPGDRDGGGDGGFAGLDGGGDKSLTPSCGQYRIPVTDQAPDVLVVLDKSGSMRESGHDRWGPSVAAVDGVVHSLPEVHFGLLTFPGDCASLPPDQQVACTA
ncbi:MAG TPA: VWA domain-containing protein, partial [Polyangiales bacterium]|nr:VWA domain-containing protein [Polyangiales bacterium]